MVLLCRHCLPHFSVKEWRHYLKKNLLAYFLDSLAVFCCKEFGKNARPTQTSKLLSAKVVLHAGTACQPLTEADIAKQHCETHTTKNSAVAHRECSC